MSALENKPVQQLFFFAFLIETWSNLLNLNTRFLFIFFVIFLIGIGAKRCDFRLVVLKQGS